MRRPHFLLISTVVVGLVLAACASPAGSGEPGASSGSEPSAAEASQAGGDGGGGGTGGIGMTLSDGTWTSGEVHVTISGDADLTSDAPLVSANSYTTGDSTVLTYISADSQSSIVVAVNTDSFAISVTTTELVAGGGTTMNCSVEYHTAEDNNIDADFSCPNSPAFTMTETSGGTVNIEGSLTASR